MNIIETKRLHLRPLTMEDVSAVVSIVGDIYVARQTATMPHPLSLEAASDWIAAALKSNDIVYGVELNGELIGKIGFKPVGPDAVDLKSPGLKSMEISYWFGADHWGFGYATEAAQAALPVIFEDPSIDLIVAGHAKDNPSSRNVIEKLGFSLIGDMLHYSLARDEGVDCLLHHLHRDDYFKRTTT